MCYYLLSNLTEHMERNKSPTTAVNFQYRHFIKNTKDSVS